MKNFTMMLLLATALLAGCKKTEDAKVYKKGEIKITSTLKSSYKVGEVIKVDFLFTPDTQCKLEGVTLDLTNYSPNGDRNVLAGKPTINVTPTNQPTNFSSTFIVSNKVLGEPTIYTNAVLTYTAFYTQGCENQYGVTVKIDNTDITILP
jgi:hypothetical protein